MFCVKCGNEIPDGARFCGSCGAPAPGGANDARSALRQAAVASQVAAEPQVATASAAPRRGKTISIVAAAAALLVVVGIGIGFLLKPKDQPANQPAQEEVYVCTSMTYTSDSSVQRLEWHYDERGNLLESSDSESKRTLSYNYDQNGFVTAVVIGDEYTNGNATLPVSNAFDNLGRITACEVNYRGEVSVAASYSYYGSSDNVSSITFQFDEGDTDYLDNFVGYTSEAIQLSFMSTAYWDAWSLLGLNEPSQVTICFSEEGQYISIGTSPDDMVSVPRYTPDEIRGRTISDENGDYTYDANGLMTHQEDNGPSHSTTDFEYEYIANPSRAVAMFYHLYEGEEIVQDNGGLEEGASDADYVDDSAAIANPPSFDYIDFYTGQWRGSAEGSNSAGGNNQMLDVFFSDDGTVRVVPLEVYRELPTEWGTYEGTESYVTLHLTSGDVTLIVIDSATLEGSAADFGASGYGTITFLFYG